jgi:uncharacterized protein (DUF58 family)
MIIPTRRLVIFFGIAAAVATVGGLVPDLAPAAWALDGLVALLALVDVAFVLGKKTKAERVTASIWSLGRKNGVAITVKSSSKRALKATVMDDPVQDASVVGLPAAVQIPPGGEVTLRYDVVPEKRGARALDGLTVRYTAPLGLVARQERTPQPAEVEVYPDVHAARALEMLRRQGRKDARLGSLRVRGGDTEFERLRPYQPGDEIRRVDWRGTARKDDLVVRQFQAESDQNVVFAIDVGRGMREKSGAEGKQVTAVDWALNAALLAADVAIRGGDKAGLLTFDDEPRAFIKPQGGKRGAARIVRAVYDLDSGLAATDYRAAMAYLKTRLRARSLLVIFTRVLEPRAAKELAAAVRVLMPTHLPLVVFFREDELERLAGNPGEKQVDLYAAAAAAEALTARAALIRRMKRDGAIVLDARPEEVTMSLVKRYLEVKARRLL